MTGTADQEKLEKIFFNVREKSWCWSGKVSIFCQSQGKGKEFLQVLIMNLVGDNCLTVLWSDRTRTLSHPVVQDL